MRYTGTELYVDMHLADSNIYFLRPKYLVIIRYEAVFKKQIAHWYFNNKMNMLPVAVKVQIIPFVLVLCQ